MSRIQKYRESLQRFIKDKSCLFENDIEDNLTDSTFIYNKIKDNDMIFPILLLTILNNQNKKNKITMQGYYIATSIEFISTLLLLIEHKSSCIKELEDDENRYLKIYTNLFINVQKSLHQNLESIKNTYNLQHQSFINIILNTINLYNTTFQTINNDAKILSDELKINNRNCHISITKWYLKDNVEMIEKFKTLKQVKKESLLEYIEKKYIVLCELAISVAWVVGGGQIKDNTRIKKIAKHFALMYKISKDFENLDSDLKESQQYTTNYILNYGLQQGYEVFLNNKQKFIEESMIEEIYTTTIKEIVDIIEANVDMIIDQTSPDLKSTYSSMNA